MSENSMSSQKSNNPEFSLGLSYRDIMMLMENELDAFLKHTPREEILDWLQWNDPNGIYSDILSMNEFGNTVTKEEGTEIIKRHILRL